MFHIKTSPMKPTNILLFGFLITLTFGCNKQIKVFSKSDNLIGLTSIRVKESLNNSFGYVGMMTKDGLFWDNVYPKINGIPDSLHDVKMYYMWLNDVQALY